MECNLVLGKDPDNNTAKLAGKSGLQSRQLCSHAALISRLLYLVGFLVILTSISLASNIYLHYNNMQLWNTVERHSQILEPLQASKENKKVDDLEKPQHDISSKSESGMKVMKRDYEQNPQPVGNRQNQQQRGRRHRRRNRGRGRSHNRRDLSTSIQNQIHQFQLYVNTTLENMRGLLLKPVVYLKAKGKNREEHATFIQYSQSIQNGCTSIKCFTWQEPDEDYQYNFDYITDTSGAETLVIGIKIRTPGFYRVHSQVVVNGNNDTLNPEVGYEMVKVSPSQGFQTATETLAESYITQDYRGKSYPDHQTHNGHTRAFDTLNTEGTFKLNCNDIILVRPKLTSQLATFRPHADKSYFGVTMINYDTRIVQHGDYSCS